MPRNSTWRRRGQRCGCRHSSFTGATTAWDIGTSRAAAVASPTLASSSFPGSESDIFLGDTTPVLEEIQSFPREEHPDFTEDRPLATVLFTDIVASTEQLSTVGDNAWRHILDDHDNTVDGAVAEHRGRVIKGLGNGILATFGPSGSQRTRDSQCDRRTRHGSARRIAHG
ncbi:MAG: hypothetical protein ACREF4_00885 [Gammaproteobacteria bacterium]